MEHIETQDEARGQLEPLLTVDELGQFLGVSRASVYRLVRACELVPIRIGERTRFSPDDVRAYLARHRVTPER